MINENIPVVYLIVFAIRFSSSHAFLWKNINNNIFEQNATWMIRWSRPKNKCIMHCIENICGDTGKKLCVIRSFQSAPYSSFIMLCGKLFIFLTNANSEHCDCMGKTYSLDRIEHYSVLYGLFDKCNYFTPHSTMQSYHIQIRSDFTFQLKHLN